MTRFRAALCLSAALIAAPPAGAEILLENPESLNDWGNSIGLSGDTLAVGARADDFVFTNAGAVFVYRQDAGGVDAWGEVARFYSLRFGLNDNFGWSVALDGDVLVVSHRRTFGAGPYRGDVSVRYRDWPLPEFWGEVAQLPKSDLVNPNDFGFALAIEGDTVLVGALRDDDAGPNAGAVYVFERDEGGPNAWGQVAKLLPANPAALHFGQSIAIDGDTAVVGSLAQPGQSGEAGPVILGRDVGGAGMWGTVAELIPAEGVQASTSTVASLPVAIQGDRAVIGSPFDDEVAENEGAAFVFERDAGGLNAWGQVAKLTVAESDWPPFGDAVAVFGDRVVVGAERHLHRSGEGAVYVFDADQGGPGAWGEVTQRSASPGVFGHNIEMPSEDTVFLSARGALSEPKNRVYRYPLFGVGVCENGIDDDGDGLSDYPADPGCDSEDDTSEDSPLLVCDDGIDNDGDGRIDFDPVTQADAPFFQAGIGDPGCIGYDGPTEAPECSDGIDNADDDTPPLADWDGAGLGDPDPDCIDRPWKPNELPTPVFGCGLGPELLPLVALLGALRRSRARAG